LRLRPGRPRPAPPSSPTQAVARSTTRSGCSNAAAVGSTSTSGLPARSRISVSSARYGSVHSPPPSSASVPCVFTGDILSIPAAVARLATVSYSPVAFRPLTEKGAGMTVKRVGIVGSGIMGAGIAEVAAKSGFDVVLRSRAQSTADAMVAGLEKSLAKQVDRGKLEASERDTVLGRIRAVTDLRELAECDLVVESIVEELAAKKHLFTELDRICPEHTILATNTSTLPVVEMAMETGRPDKVCGIHFFNPAPRMALVEVVRAITSSDATIAEAVEFATTCGKSAVQVRDQAGFVVNALLFPYLNNAVRLYDAGVASRDDI